MLRISINLLNPISKPEDKAETIFNWVLVWGKFLTLGAALFLILVFGFRIFIDTKKNELADTVEDYYIRVTQLESSKVNYVMFQQFLNSVKLVRKNQQIITDKQALYEKYFSNVLKLEAFSINGGKLDFAIQLSSSEELASLEKNLDADGYDFSIASDYDYKPEGKEIRVTGSITLTTKSK